MSYNIDIKHGHHVWEKQNMVTIYKGKNHYDIMKCAGCGIEGRTSSISTIQLKGSYSSKKVKLCPAYIRPEITTETFIVKTSPWPNRLPIGTEIIECSPRGEESPNGNWFKKLDGTILFDEEPDGKFCLMNYEFEKKQLK